MKIRSAFYEAGASWGLMPSVRWKADGVEWKYGTPSQFTSYQKSDPALLLRLDGGAGVRLAGNMFLRMGIYAAYLHAAGFDGTTRGSDGTYYTLANGGIVPIGADSLSTYAVQYEAGALDSVILQSIEGKTEMNLTFAGIYFSAGIQL